jgi:hypothetical protein
LTTNKARLNAKWIFESPTRCQRQKYRSIPQKKKKKQKLLALTLNSLTLERQKKKSFLFLLFLFFHFDAPLLPSKEEDAPKVAGEEEPA